MAKHKHKHNQSSNDNEDKKATTHKAHRSSLTKRRTPKLQEAPPQLPPSQAVQVVATIQPVRSKKATPENIAAWKEALVKPHTFLQSVAAEIQKPLQQQQPPPEDLGKNIVEALLAVQQTLNHLFLVRWSREVLLTSKFGRFPFKWSSKFPKIQGAALEPHRKQILNVSSQIQQDSATLVMYFKAVIGAADQAFSTLQKFRTLQSKLEQEGRPKPDMVAYKELRNQKATKSHGELKGVPIGLVLSGRGEAAILGIHTAILAGIDFTKEEACYAVCSSGKYNDKEESALNGGVIHYTGMGGLNKEGKQTEDQQKTPANSSLIRSYKTQKPIRVLRKDHSNPRNLAYRYEGLYRCNEYTYKGSPKVYTFHLTPIPGKSLVDWHIKQYHLRHQQPSIKGLPSAPHQTTKK